MTYYPSQTRGSVQLDPNQFTLFTGNNNRNLKTLSEITPDEEILSYFGTEGSGVKLKGLVPGVYSVDCSMYSRDSENDDGLFVWNGKRIVKIGSKKGGTQESTSIWKKNWSTTVEVLYDFLCFIALDDVTLTGNTNFTISNLQYITELPYLVPEPISLIPTITLGDVKIEESVTRITNSTGSRAISTLSQALTGDRNQLTEYGTEGSFGLWQNLLPGIYEIKLQISTAELDGNKDAVYAWVDRNLLLFAHPQQANRPLSPTRKISPMLTTQLRVETPEMGFIAVDTVDKTGTTELLIHRIERIAEIFFDEEVGIDESNSPETAWFLGTLYPEGVETNGMIWNNGQITNDGPSGITQIIELIGGDDVVDYFKFNLTLESTLRITATNVIAALLNDQANSVIWDSDDAYESNATITLSPGQYYLQYSTESSMSEQYNSTLYFTQV
ncbi:hypothetical protein [Laspinema olomoucense]|uniref:hypothetical protein n=1 Tax=Laspinema olomoucense TaxID=3231600 RepID=UPI0021BAD8FD|nr:hypothetical protein [Laspinema sp. D3d]MCT7971142.1 hypothetical protein [Laspinema sp. D3d]